MLHEDYFAHGARDKRDRLNYLSSKLLVVRAGVLVQARQKKIEGLLEMRVKLVLNHDNGRGEGGDRVFLLDRNAIFHQNAESSGNRLHMGHD